MAWHIDNGPCDTAIQLEPEPRSGTRVVLTFVPGNVSVLAQGFCDEVFRVFALAHPQIVLAPTGMNESVAFMVERARRRA